MVIGGKAGFGLGREYSADAPAPAPTLMKNGIAGVNFRQFEVTASEQPPKMPPSSRKRWEKLKVGENDPERFSLIKSDPEQPVSTILKDTGGNTVTHPFQPRKFTIPELRRLGGFPDDFQLVGSFGQQWERVGNSVPPPMAYRVAVALRDALLAANARPGSKHRT
jgi:DNA (cytosine-5)-methyltransferase 1